MKACTGKTTGISAGRFFRDLMPSLAVLLSLANPVSAVTVNGSFDVTATLQNGCLFGVNSSSSSNMGTLSFGSQSATATNVDVVSSAGSGSIVVTCTPGASVSIALDYGANGGSSAQRYLKNSTGTRTLPYQLYRDAARSQVWGTGTLALTVSSFPSTTQTYTVYARYFGATPLPAAGQYTDSVTINVTY
ncbi:spore coat U domain-containing protein [Candidatus Symbiopectobacterium sp. NZEC151]|uniref:Csu type fimbrial protein n=2 Tax=unclassified Symbiopectobacterium TaxID=2794573 RepID=UPI002227C09F|nr:spore coat U domain-containing protein [Candidatus Symbiopectobacterium sp. NZEC151]